MDNESPSKPDDPMAQPLDLPGGETQQSPHQNFQSTKSRKSFKKPLLILLLLLALGGIGFSIWKMLSKPRPTVPPQTNEPTAKPLPTQSEAAAKGFKNFTAETLAVEFSYPDNWTVAEKDGTITVKSPTFSYQTTQGTTNGYFRIYIRKGARSVDSKYIGRAYAVQPTQQITYTNPAVSQRKTTNLSFFGYDDASNFAFFMITGNFNLKKGETLGPNYGKEAETYIIVGGYSSAEDKDDLSFRMISPSSFQQANAYKQAIEILKSLKVS